EFVAEDVESITVHTAPWAILHGGATGQPTDMISAQFNLGFSVALRLLKKSNALPFYADPQLWSDPDVRALSDATRVVGLSFAPGESELGALVEVTLRSGRVVSRREQAFRGHPSNPAGPAD